MSSGRSFRASVRGSVSRYVDEKLDSDEKNGENMARINDGALCEK